jgi:hypothetical protein
MKTNGIFDQFCQFDQFSHTPVYSYAMPFSFSRAYPAFPGICACRDLRR